MYPEEVFECGAIGSTTILVCAPKRSRRVRVRNQMPNSLRAESMGHMDFRYLGNPELGVFDVRLDVDVDKLLTEPAGHQRSF